MSYVLVLIEVTYEVGDKMICIGGVTTSGKSFIAVNILRN
jgi:hypothetical protein